MVATLDGLATGEIEARPQQVDGVSFAPKITVDDARIDWSQPAELIDRQVRACTPFPGAWTTADGDRLKVGPLSVTDERLAPGELLIGKNSVHIGTGTGAVLLGEVKAHGKKQMRAADWARGLRETPTIS